MLKNVPKISIFKALARPLETLRKIFEEKTWQNCSGGQRLYFEHRVDRNDIFRPILILN